VRRPGIGKRSGGRTGSPLAEPRRRARKARPRHAGTGSGASQSRGGRPDRGARGAPGLLPQQVSAPERHPEGRRGRLPGRGPPHAARFPVGPLRAGRLRARDRLGVGPAGRHRMGGRRLSVLLGTSPGRRVPENAGREVRPGLRRAHLRLDRQAPAGKTPKGPSGLHAVARLRLARHSNGHPGRKPRQRVSHACPRRRVYARVPRRAAGQPLRPSGEDREAPHERGAQQGGLRAAGVRDRSLHVPRVPRRPALDGAGGPADAGELFGPDHARRRAAGMVVRLQPGRAARRGRHHAAGGVDGGRRERRLPRSHSRDVRLPVRHRHARPGRADVRRRLPLGQHVPRPQRLAALPHARGGHGAARRSEVRRPGEARPERPARRDQLRVHRRGHVRAARRLGPGADLPGAALPAAGHQRSSRPSGAG